MRKEKRWNEWRESLAALSLRDPHPAPLRNTALGNLFRTLRDHHSLRLWQRGSRSAFPPAAVKREAIKKLAAKHGCTVFVETGTYKGDTLYALRNRFDELHSIELHPELHALSRRRFEKRNNVHLYQGDSRRLLPGIVARLEQRTLFWLDAHYSGGITAKGRNDTPIREELQTILGGDGSGERHVILIDDAHEFGVGDYPSLMEVTELAVRHGGEWEVSMATNMIAIEPL